MSSDMDETDDVSENKLWTGGVLLTKDGLLFCQYRPFECFNQNSLDVD